MKMKQNPYIVDGKVEMSVYALRNEYYKHNPEGHWFDDDTLKFFGNRLSEMRVLRHTEQIKDFRGEMHKCYCLSLIQRPGYRKPYRDYKYFDINTFDVVYDI